MGSTISSFHISTDKIAIGRINESLSTLQQARDLRLKEADNALKSTQTVISLTQGQYIDIGFCEELSRSLATMSQQHKETVMAQNGTDHASHIVELDTQKFRIAKAASDLEIEGERLEQELEGLKGRLHELDVQGVEGDDAAKARREIDDPAM